MRHITWCFKKKNYGCYRRLQNFTWSLLPPTFLRRWLFVEYKCMELKRDNNVGGNVFIFSKFNNKCQIELNATFGQFSYEILVLLRKSSKSRSTNEIIALMRNKFVFIFLLYKYRTLIFLLFFLKENFVLSMLL